MGFQRFLTNVCIFLLNQSVFLNLSRLPYGYRRPASLNISPAHRLKLRNEWGYKYFVTCDAGSVDLLITTHGTCGDRECAARTAIENYSGEMGGGTYTYLTLPGKVTFYYAQKSGLILKLDQVRAGNVSVSYIDDTVKTILRTKFSLGLFESA